MNDNKKYRLFLDDVRRPETTFSYMELPIYNEPNWIIVKNYYAFITLIQNKGIPEVISFDHDLGIGVTEKWKDVIGYKGIYKISDLGRVIIIKKCKGTQGDNILTPIKNESGLCVTLRNQGNDIQKKSIDWLVKHSY